MKKENLYSVEGIVSNIEDVSPHAQIITLIPMLSGAVKATTPFYGKVEEELIGKYVSISTNQRGFFFGPAFVQTIEGLNLKKEITIPYSIYQSYFQELVKCLNGE